MVTSSLFSSSLKPVLDALANLSHIVFFAYCVIVRLLHIALSSTPLHLAIHAAFSLVPYPIDSMHALFAVIAFRPYDCAMDISGFTEATTFAEVFLC